MANIVLLPTLPIGLKTFHSGNAVIEGYLQARHPITHNLYLVAAKVRLFVADSGVYIASTSGKNFYKFSGLNPNIEYEVHGRNPDFTMSVRFKVKPTIPT